MLFIAKQILQTGIPATFMAHPGKTTLFCRSVGIPDDAIVCSFAKLRMAPTKHRLFASHQLPKKILLKEGVFERLTVEDLRFFLPLIPDAKRQARKSLVAIGERVANNNRNENRQKLLKMKRALEEAIEVVFAPTVCGGKENARMNNSSNSRKIDTDQ